MKFQIKRTSEYGSDQQPCPEAVRETISGTVYGNERSEDVWVVEIADLDSLMQVYSTHGDLVVTSPFLVTEAVAAVIEIYDDYRE